MQTLVDLGELPRLVRDFVSYKLTVQGRSKKTADEYALDLRTFLWGPGGGRCIRAFAGRI